MTVIPVGLFDFGAPGAGLAAVRPGMLEVVVDDPPVAPAVVGVLACRVVSVVEVDPRADCLTAVPPPPQAAAMRASPATARTPLVRLIAVILAPVILGTLPYGGSGSAVIRWAWFS
ncbi:MAG TPA: hypothetical protein VFA11_15165 [Acidimicrobiales bacterium]|nr:hypothetical protein [Acidimicrobiales bacterium]